MKWDEDDTTVVIFLVVACFLVFAITVFLTGE